jgi:hypothetical protein
MEVIKRMTLGMLLLFSLILAGCGGPPSEIFEEAVKKDLDVRMGFNIGTILDLDITNDYTQDQRDETVYFFEYEARVKHHPDMLVFVTKKAEGTYTGTVALVKRGSEWYRLR